MALRVLDGSGNAIAAGVGQVTVRSPRARMPFSVAIGSADGASVATYSLAIAPRSPGRVVGVSKVGSGARRHVPVIHRLRAPQPRWQALAPTIPHA